MSHVASFDRPLAQPLPIADIIPSAIFAGLLFVIATYFVGAEQGAVSLFAGNGVHEFVHDARHLLGFPCH